MAWCVQIRLNGEGREVDESCSVADLLEILDLADRRVAVELNRDILPRARYSATTLVGGDVVEVVQFVGGG